MNPHIALFRKAWSTILFAFLIIGAAVPAARANAGYSGVWISASQNVYIMIEDGATLAFAMMPLTETPSQTNTLVGYGTIQDTSVAGAVFTSAGQGTFSFTRKTVLGMTRTTATVTPMGAATLSEIITQVWIVDDASLLPGSGIYYSVTGGTTILASMAIKGVWNGGDALVYIGMDLNNPTASAFLAYGQITAGAFAMTEKYATSTGMAERSVSGTAASDAVTILRTTGTTSYLRLQL